MSKMKKKYLLEIEETKDGNFAWSNFAPYTEPDIEKVRKEAYDKGYQDATEKISSDEQAIADKAYKQGLSDAWEAVRKIYNLDLKEREALFPNSDRLNIGSICETYFASEAIEKIRQYEQEQNRQARIEYNFDEIKDVLNTTMKECNVSLDEIAAVLAKMKEES